MIIVDFERKHIEAARQLAISNYYEECEQVPELPKDVEFPALECFADNNLGVAALEDENLIGFLGCYTPWEQAFSSNAIGTFSPIHAHGAIKENRKRIYQYLYQAAAEKWVASKIAYHAVSLYAHDTKAIQAFWGYGFGLRCIDAIRPMKEIEIIFSENTRKHNKQVSTNNISFEEVSKDNVKKVRKLRQLLSEHLGQSPCFMYSRKEEYEQWLNRAEARDSRLFIACDDKEPIAFVEIMDEAENFVTEVPQMKNICGAYCSLEYRGQGIYQNLLNHMIHKLKAEGFSLLGVDFESFNPTANSFWNKHFTAYTNSVVRRIDECAIR